MTASDGNPVRGEHPWRGIALEVYERHMSDARVGQLQKLYEVTREQLAAHRSRVIGILGVAGGNGLDLIDPQTTDGVYGYDINPAYLEACGARYRGTFGDRLHLVEASIDRSVVIEPVGLLIANLLVEYVGVEAFAAFAAANAGRIGVLSCVIQRNDDEGFVSATDDAAAFEGLESVASVIDPETLASALSGTGLVEQCRIEYRLPNGKTLIRQDFGNNPRH